ncbi:MAG TPA: flagellar filament capping protein FliD [Candidatus Hydrogenedentes bacterium]|nr:flagellar filament capping protein FliD [Candidatus Hydrogenedentota bacterium]
MSSGWSAGGLISGLDTATLISQLVAIKREPETRIQTRITTLQSQQTALKELRTQLFTLRNRIQDFRLNNVFNAYKSSTSEDTVLTSSISSSTPVVGSFVINVTQLASATVATSSSVMGGNIDPNAALNSSGITTNIEAGTFTINGVAFNVDPTTDSLNSILADINSSAAGVTATYDAVNDKVLFTNTAAGDTDVINFGASGDESNFLTAISIKGATQYTGPTGSTTVTSTVHLGSIDGYGTLNTENFVGGTATSGVFTINGIQISVDASTDTLMDVIERINMSDAGVTASYDASTDSVVVLSKTLGSRTISFGSASDTSNFLSITNLSAATQTAGTDAQFTVNGGAVQTRNTNEVSDAITGVTLNLLSTGTSTVTVASDDDKIVEGIQTFIEEFNNSITKIRELTGEEGALKGDSGIQSIENFLRQNIFAQVSGLNGDYDSLLSIGISTGKDFDPAAVQLLELDEDKLREALRENRTNVSLLLTNSSGSGVADLMFDYLDEATKTTGFLNERAKSSGTIDVQIRSLNDQIDRIEDQVSQYETRLRRQFSAMEQMMSSMQSQSSALSSLSSYYF